MPTTDQLAFDGGYPPTSVLEQRYTECLIRFVVDEFKTCNGFVQWIFSLPNGQWNRAFSASSQHLKDALYEAYSQGYEAGKVS